MSNSDANGVSESIASLALTNDPPMAAPHPQVFSPGPALTKNDFYDITDEFNAASELLAVGELVKDPAFTLFQAVGALEIMDSKMDSGLLKPEYETFDAAKPRSPGEVIGVMDRLLCHEIAWNLGSALAQTVFTNLYIDKLFSTRSKNIDGMTFGSYKGGNDDMLGSELVSEVLRPYCLALIKCCGLVIHQIQQEHVYEEEDFITQAYGRNLLDFYGADQVSALVDGAIEWLSKHEESLTPEVYRALKTRMMLRQRLLLDLSIGLNIPGREISERWNATEGMIDSLVATHQLAEPVDWAWSISIQRKLASQVPPRPIVDIPFQEAVDKLRFTCRDISVIPRIWETDAPIDVLSYFYHFMARKHVPLPYTRTLLQSAFSKNGMILQKFRIHEFAFEDLKDLCVPHEALFDKKNRTAEAPQSPAYQIRERMNWFGERAGRAFFEIFRILTQNRARLRRNLCHTILDWDNLQIEAEEVDNELKDLTQEVPRLSADGTQELYAFPLSSWVYYYKIRQMELIHLLGFELDIYQPHEFAGMYWYLQHYLRARISHLTRIRDFVSPHLRRGTGSGKRENGSDREAEERAKRSYAWLNYLMMEGGAVHDLATALTLLYIVMARFKLIKKPRQLYSTDELRYELRMEPFLTIGVPEVLPFEHFQIQATMEFHDNATLLEQAGLAAAEAKKQIQFISKLDAATSHSSLCESDHKTYINHMLRSCLGVGVAIGVLAREVEEAGFGTMTGEDEAVRLEKVEAEFVRDGYHPSFPVPKIKRL